MIKYILLLFVMCTPSRSIAGAIGIDACTKQKECMAHLDRAMNWYANHDYHRALEGFIKAYEIAPTPILLINIGRTQFHLGHIREAIASFQKCKIEAPQLDAQELDKLDRYLREAQDALSQKSTLEPQTDSHQQSQPFLREDAINQNKSSAETRTQNTYLGGQVIKSTPPVASAYDSKSTEAGRTTQIGHSKRGKALIAIGIPVTIAGLALVILGAASITFDGRCAESGADNSCRSRYVGLVDGIAEVVAGGVSLIGGVTMITIGRK